jgi:hypothetical protein
MVRAGDRVAVPSDGIVGTVLDVDVRCVGGAACPCCGRGVSVRPDGEPNASMGFAPGDCVPLAPGPAMLARGGAA